MQFLLQFLQLDGRTSLMAPSLDISVSAPCIRHVSISSARDTPSSLLRRSFLMLIQQNHHHIVPDEEKPIQVLCASFKAPDQPVQIIISHLSFDGIHFRFGHLNVNDKSITILVIDYSFRYERLLCPVP